MVLRTVESEADFLVFQWIDHLLTRIIVHNEPATTDYHIEANYNPHTI
jgi:hypothetical protein